MSNLYPSPCAPPSARAAEDDALYGPCAASALPPGEQAWRGRHAWLQHQIDQRRLSVMRERASAVGAPPKKLTRVGRTGVIRCVEMPGQTWPNSFVARAELDLPVGETAINTAISQQHGCCGLHFYRGDTVPVFPKALRRMRVYSVSTGETYDDGYAAARAMLGLSRDTPAKDARIHAMSMSIYRSCNDTTRRTLAAGAVWRRVAQVDEVREARTPAA